MLKIQLSRFFALLISLSLLIAPLPLSAMAGQIASNVSELELSAISQSDEQSYIYLGKDASNIIDILSDIGQLDDHTDSPLHTFKQYIDQGFLVAECDAVFDVLHYAESVLNNKNDGKNDQLHQLTADFTLLVDKVFNDDLTFNLRSIDINQFPQVNDPTGCPKYIFNTARINQNLEVCGETTLNKHLHTKQGAHLQGKLKVGKSAKFEKNVTVKGNLFAANLSVADTTFGSLSVNDLVVNNCMNNLCVNNLSVVDESISGTLSVNNAFITNGIIENLTVTVTVLDSVINNLTVNQTLSAHDAIISNETVTGLSVTNAVVQNLSVANCVSNLCVNNLSVVNESVSGTLSANNAVINNLTSSGGTLSLNDTVIQNSTITDLSANDATIQNITVVNCIPNLCVDDISVNNAVINNILQLQDPGPGFVGLQAPVTVPTSYILSLPSTVPTANQFLRANVTVPTNLEWANSSGSVPPVTSRTIYVTTYGNDITGDGSFSNPYATLSQAIALANTLASAVDPLTISISTGIYIEDNSMNSLTVTASGVAIIGEVSSNVIIMPNTPTNNLLLVNAPIHISEVTFESSAPLATGLTLASGDMSSVIDVDFVNFLVGAECVGGPTDSYGFVNCFFANNGTGLLVNDAYVEMNDNTIFGTAALVPPSLNNAITITGVGADLVINGGIIGVCETAIMLLNNATASITGVAFRGNTFDINQSGASRLTLASSTFELTTDSSDIDVQVSGAGTMAQIVGCEFNGSGLSGTPEGSAIFVSNNASVNMSGDCMHNYTTGITVGTSTDTSSTSFSASAIIIRNCTNDIIQQGSSTLNFNASTASGAQININDATNVNLAFFDLNDNDALSIGSTANVDTTLIQAAIADGSNAEVSNNLEINYKASLYSTQAIGFENQYSTPSSWFVLSNNNTDLTAITTNNSDVAGIRLVSDTASPVGGTSALRGWDINKNGSAAQLSFAYQNSDIVGQIAIPQYTVMQLDGFANQLQLPTAGTQIVFDGDTNLYRSAANVLKTDDNFIVGTLTPGFAVITDATTNQLSSSTTSSTELSFVHGVTSPIQTQLNGKLSLTGGTLTGPLSATNIIANNISVTGLSATDAIVQNASVTNLSVTNQVIQNVQVTNVSVVDATVSGTLSVNNEIVQNSSIVNLSATNAVIQNLSATDVIVQQGTVATLSSTDAILQNLIVNNCMTNLCVNNLSVVNETVSGTLSVNNELINDVLKFSNISGNYVGLQAPSSIPTNYTLSLPSAVPTVNQTLRAGSITPTNLAWITDGGSVLPSVSGIIYVTTYGNDITGNGSFDNPYASLAQGISVANSLASASNPVVILMGPGIYIENNSAGPLAVTANGIAIVGDSANTTIIFPSTVSNDLLSINNGINIANVTFEVAGSSTATGLSLVGGSLLTISDTQIINFQNGIVCTAASALCTINNCLFIENQTNIIVNDSTLECNDCTIIGSTTQTAVSIAGAGSIFIMSGGTCIGCETGISIGSNVLSVTIAAVTFQLNKFDIVQTGGSSSTISGCTFELTTSSSDIKIQLSGAGTFAEVISCSFNGNNISGLPEGTGMLVTDNAFLGIAGGVIINYTTALQVGTSTDTSSTTVTAASLKIRDCTTDILQEGSTTLNFNACTASSSKISINDSTNVNLAFFDLDNDDALTIGSMANVNTDLINVAIGGTGQLGLNYLSSLYGTEAIGFNNNTDNPSASYALSPNSTNFTAVTTDRTQIAGLRLVSDTGFPVGGTSALRGWDINKNGSAAQLSFAYQNSDIVGQIAVPEYTVMQLDGLNNIVQLPTAGTKIVFDGDTNLYRSAANVLKTDDNFIVGTLTPGFAVITDATTNQLSSSTTSSTELSFVHGVTSPIQTQLNGKLSLTGGTLTGPLSATDIIANNLSVTGLSATDAILQNASVTNLSVTNQVIQNVQVTNVSVGDATVTGTLSVNNEIVQNSSIVNLSATNAVIQNLSTTDAIVQQGTVATLSSTDAVLQNLIVTNCMTNLCVNNLSVVNETVSGTLSVNDELINDVLKFSNINGNYVGLQAPSSIPTNYTLSFPSAVPAANQTLRSGTITPTDLTWISSGGSVVPASSKTIYVAKYGNDITGNGSFDSPYASLAEAITVANGIASAVNPVAIVIESGIYVENNSAGPLAITTQGISIVGASINSVVISPNTPANNLLSANNTTYISNVTFQSSTPLATAITLTTGSLSALSNVRVINFLVGISYTGSSSDSYRLNTCVFADNGTAIDINDAFVECNTTIIFGATSLTSPAANSGVNITGSGSRVIFDSSLFGLLINAFTITNNATVTINASEFRFNEFDITQSGASQLTLSACTIAVTNSALEVDINISGAGTTAEIIGCDFNGDSSGGVPEATCIQVTDNAVVNISGGSIRNYSVGIQVGTSIDTSATNLSASAVVINNCATNIMQEGSSTLSLNAVTAASNLIAINDPTNVALSFFDLDSNDSLFIGSTANQNTTLLQAGITSTTNPEIDYLSSLYSTQAVGLNNPLSSSSSWFIISQENANLTAITTDRTQIAGLRLVSDTASPVGGTSALRGWDINKNGSAAQLSFAYQNSDIVGQIAIPEYTVMQLDGFANQLQLPTAGTQIVFDGDTNLYRSAANVLQTDDNFIVGTLTPGFAVITDPTTNELASSTTSSTELSYVHGVTSPIQTQLNGKLSLTGGTLTGTLTLPAGTAAVPSLQFTGSTNTGLSAATANVLSFDINGVEQMNISSSGVTIDNISSSGITIQAFNTAGVVHNNASGLLTSSLIVDADITAATITNDKLATISSADVPGDIVVRNGSGDFATNMITIDGTTTNATDVATKAYVDSVTSTGLVPHPPATVVGTTNVPLTGLQTIDGVTLVENDRVLLVGQSNAVQNGLWLAQAGDWTRPTDFSSGTEAGPAYVLILEGTVYEGSSWLCSTPTAIIDTDPIEFSLFALPNTTTGANVGGGSGLVFQSKTGVTLNFRSLSVADSYMSIVTNSDNVGFSTNATNLDTASTIVARDASGNFVANIITANLTGTASNNLPLSGGTLTGTLVVPAGTILAPSIEFTGSSTGTGFSTPTANQLSFDISGSEQMNINSSGVNIAGILSVDDEIINGTLQIASLSTGVLHSDSSGDITSSLIVDADITAATITNDKLANISSTNIPGDIVVRDASGNFSANTIIASLTGSASLDLPLAGGTMTGTLQLPAGSTSLPSLIFTGSTTTGLSASAGDLSFSTSGIERMEISSGGTISIDAFTAAGIVHNDSSGNLSSSLIVNADVSASAGITDSKLATISTAGKVANSATTATTANTPNTIVLRDNSGNFSAGTITANLNGNATTATSATTATTATNFTGSLAGDVTGTQSATVVSFVGGQTAANVAAATVIVDAATNLDTPNTLVERDASGNFSAGTITANLSGNATTATTAVTTTNFTGSLSGDVTGTQSATVVSFVGGQTAANIAAATVIVDAATSLDTPNTLVERDGTGSFAAGVMSVTDVVVSDTVTITPFSTAGVVHNNASGLLSSSLIVNADVDPNASIVDTKLATIMTAGKVANSATTATSLDTPSTIVARDASGNFSANTIIASLTGSASLDLPLAGGTMTGTLQLPAGSTSLPSLIFTGSTTTGLSASAGDLSFSTSGIERMEISSGGTISVDAFTAAGIVHNDSSGNLSSSLIVNSDISTTASITDNKLNTISTAGKVANSATTATNLDTPNTIVLRDATGNFSAGTITANLNGNATTATSATTATTATNFTGSLAGDVTGTQSATVVSFVGGQTAANVAAATVIVDAATNLDTPNTLVERDASGNFSAGTITANLSGNATTATTAVTTTNFTGSLSGDVTGTQSATVVSFVGGQTAANIAAATVIVDAATNLDTPNTLVERDGTGSFAAGVMSVTDVVVSDTVTITPFSTAGVVHNNASGLLSSSLIVNADVDPNASIVDTKLATISTAGKVANSATTATSLDTPSTIVARDASGNFSANTIIASLIGGASLDLPLAGGTMTGTLQLPAGSTSLPSLTFTGSTTTGLSASAGDLSFSTSGIERMEISSGGTISVDAFTAAGVVHNDSSGNLSSSLIVNSDISTTASITDNKLNTISTPGKVANSATTATSLNTPNAIVARDSAGNFAAQEISMNDGILAGNLILSTDPSTSSAGNIIKGSNRFIHDFGTNNTFVGVNAGNFVTTGSGGNSAFGASSLISNTTGAFNTAIGYSALNANSIGVDNVAVGYNSLLTNVTGTDNTALGYNSLSAVTTGSTNTAIGSGAGGTLTTGSGNIYINANAAATNEAATTRIGTSQTACFIQGINGVTPSGSNSAVTINSNGQLGTGAITNLVITNATITHLSATDEFVTGLSVVNETITGTLSVNNEIATSITATNETVTTLSVTNEIATNLTATHLSATDEFVTGLSVVNETITGTLSVVNEIATNLTVTTLSVTNEVITNLAVTNLSVTNETVTGTLSVANEVATNITATNETITTLSVTNEIATNLTATHLSATDEFVTGLSVVNETITGTLSVVNEIATNLTATNFSASDEFVTGLSVVNETITGTLSVASEIATNLTVATLSVTNEVATNIIATNETVTTLSVTNEIATNLTATHLSATDEFVTGLSVVNETITGALSVVNEIATNLTVTTLSVTNEVITNLAVTNLSVTNETVTGTLSVANEVATNITATNETITTLSVTNEIAANLTATTLSVTNEIATNLTATHLSATDEFVTGLSVVNETITGTLSVVNEIATNLTVATLSVTNEIATNLTATNLSATDEFVTGLSVVNETITGTLSVVNEIATNLTVTTLSVTNEAITNLAVTNLSVTNETVTGTLSVANEIATNLTATNFSASDEFVTGLSVVNETITGTLSVVSEIATNLTVTTLSVTNEIATNLTATNLSATDEFVTGLSVVNETITGTLSVVNEIATNLTVTTLSVTNEAITNLAVTNLSVTNETATGTLSVANEIATNLTATNLSATDGYIEFLSVVDETITGTSSINDALITNATIANLSITNCLASLCVNNLSVVNGSVSGTLSVNSEIATSVIATNETITTLSVTNEFISDNLTLTTEPSTSTAGNIIKGSSRFIHDFGTNNTFVGINSGNFTMSGSGGNSAFGNSALNANSTGAFNTAIGYNTLALNTTGANNTALGYNVLAANTIGTNNTAVGYLALDLNTTGTFNTAVGSTCLNANTIGGSNTAVGTLALSANTTGNNNTAVGEAALQTNSTGSNNTAVGQNALDLNAGSSNTAVGQAALQNNSTGTLNTAVGASALTANTIGIHNTALGYNSLAASTTGTDNTAIGYDALAANATGTSFNTAVGSSALVVNTTGTNNAAVGYHALTANTTGINNTALGYNTLPLVTTGDSNIAVGASAGGTLTTGSGNIYIGANAGSATEANTIRIGGISTQTACYIQGIFNGTPVATANVHVSTGGLLAITTSSQRFKHNIQDMNESSADIFKLRPVTFAYNNDETETLKYGLIAEEVNEIFPELIVPDQEGAPYTIQYDVLPVLLLNEMKKQQLTIEELKDDNAQRDAMIQSLFERIKALEARA